MSDFISGFWGPYVAIATVVSIAGCAWLLMLLSKRKVAGDPEKTNHVWDEDLDELNNPLPLWWIGLFWITIVFSVGYLWFYPGLGTFEGSTRWTSAGEHAEDVAAAEKQYGPLYAKFAATDIAELSRNPEARALGQKLFLNYCSQCHASDARGGRGFPNLTDNDWLYGGTPEAIKASILEGRNGTMPPMGAAVNAQLGPEGTRDVANYVRSLSGLQHDAARAERGKAGFTACAACHGADGKGNTAIGAPNLTDKVWLHGSSESMIVETVTKGRQSKMPAHKDLLGEARVHVLAAYIYGLSNPGK